MKESFIETFQAAVEAHFERRQGDPINPAFLAEITESMLTAARAICEEVIGEPEAMPVAKDFRINSENPLMSLATVMGPPSCHEHGTTVGRL